MSICAIVMAAGEGKRMKSKKCKFIQKTAGKPIIIWVREALLQAGADEQVYIVGHLQEQVRQVLGEDVAFVLQEKQLGTGHAVMQASPFLEGRQGITLVIRGDTPLITSETLRNVMNFYKEGKYAAVIITADTNESTGYGKIVRDTAGNVAEIVINHGNSNGNSNGVFGGMFEGNSSMYCFDTPLLVSVLGRIGCNNANSEYCLTDAIEILIKDGRKVGAYKAPFEETLGVHDKFQLMQISKLLNRRICRNHMKEGVSILDPDTTWIEASVKISRDAEILPGTILEGTTTIGEDAVIGPDTRLTDTTVEDEAIIYNSIVAGSTIRTGACIGPYSYIRTGSVIGAHARIGNSVEVKNAQVGDYTKALNLAYIGDAEIGENVNFGCGSVIANFDGNYKNKTKIGDNSFIGSNSNIIAPVQISANTYVAAGSTITDDIPAFAMAIARNRQVVKENWVLNRGDSLFQKTKDSKIKSKS
ncbi:MAG: bifunctional UDP-N-acetylglucosamine diphosphorylase/glucosamine-1-phosphate N-acetyltransferase GlmU [Saccharofermentanales bacterium]